MADETETADRQHPATARQEDRFAERGEVPRSRELGAALGLAVGASVIALRFPRSIAVLVGATRQALAQPARGLDGWSVGHMGELLWQAVGPLLLACVAAAVAAQLLQNRGRLVWVTPSVSLARLNPGPRLAQLLGPRQALTNIAYACLKVLLVGGLCGRPLVAQLPGLVAAPPADLAAAAAAFGALFGAVAWRGVVAFVALGLTDYAVNAYRLAQRMRMTTQQVRDEAKEDSGDPQVRGRRRRRHLEAARRARALTAVPGAAVVLVNPTHYAVALAYEVGRMRAPQVVARGAGALAQRIRALARRHQVPVVSQPPLARALYAQVPLGHPIPERLYQAVAVVLAHVMRQPGRVG